MTVMTVMMMMIMMMMMTMMTVVVVTRKSRTFQLARSVFHIGSCGAREDFASIQFHCVHVGRFQGQGHEVTVDATRLSRAVVVRHVKKAGAGGRMRETGSVVQHFRFLSLSGGHEVVSTMVDEEVLILQKNEINK